MISLLHDFYDSKCFLIVVMGFGIYMFVTLQEPWMIGIANGQEVNRTEEASRQAKEILCKEYYLEYCEGQEVNNITSDCFTLRDFFSPYHGWSRCILD